MGTEHGELEPASMQAYHVKNNLGEYCKWDASLETPGFASLGNGKTDFSQLSLEEKQSATFHTSLNGAISKIPVDFTVEIQEVLAGTRYRLEERESEIPDGYSLQKYILYENESGGNSVDENDSNDGDSNESGADLSAGGQDIVNHYVVGTVDSNPHIKVCNLKGFGLRINKEWSDKEYMEDRAPTYFAVFTDDGNGNLTLVGDASGPRDQSTGADSAANADSIPGTTEPAVFSTVRQLTYGTNPQTLYWYFEHLPVLDVSFDKYVVREVTLGNSNPTVDENGYVTNYGSVTVVGGSDQNGTLTLSGRQIGQEENSPYTYTVTYEDGSIERDANVHVFSAKNSRPGVKLYKKDGDKPLANAKFRLSKGDTLIGEFTSDADGLVTEAFLQPGETYTYELMEMVSPQSYQGLQGPIQLTLVGSTLNVVDENGTGQRYTPETGASMPTYTIQNTPYEFQVVKADQSGHPLPGVIFALHRQKTVDGHTGIEVEPESGYENLVTGADGIVPKLDKTLPPGTWELRETGSLPAYLPLSGHIRFTISDTGVISLVDGNYPADEVELTSYKTDVPKKITYTMTITNRTLPMTLKKEDDAGHPLAGARFTLMMLNTSGVWINLGSSGAAGGLTETGAGSVIDMSTCTETSLPVLTNGLYCLEEQIAPEGYVILKKYVYFTVQDGIITLTDETGTALGQADPQAVLSGNSSSGYTLTIKNSPGAALPATGGAGTRLFTVLGSILVMFAGVILWRKRRLFVER